MKQYCIVIAGATGVGKSSFAERLAQTISAEIVNADMGQLYCPLTIGTAKPLWRQSSIKHHLFDVLDQPDHYSVMEYRLHVQKILNDIWSRDRIPIIVGGSTLYIQSLFFPPQSHGTLAQTSIDNNDNETSLLWQKLSMIDPERAQMIHPHDRYRICRALNIWYTMGKKPSQLKPEFDPIAPSKIIFLDRDRAELYQSINQRVHSMLQQGWLDEVQALYGTAWEPFLLEKKIIGYDVILQALSHNALCKEDVAPVIAQKTRNYAKRQMIFWNRLKILLNDVPKHHNTQTMINVESINLTLCDLDLYIKQLSEQILTHE